MSEFMSLDDIERIFADDAISRVDIWAKFSHEFLRLGMLCYAMRGPQTIMFSAAQAAKAARDQMVKEIGNLEGHVKMLEKKLVALKEKQISP